MPRRTQGTSVSRRPEDLGHQFRLASGCSEAIWRFSCRAGCASARRVLTYLEPRSDGVTSAIRNRQALISHTGVVHVQEGSGEGCAWHARRGMVRSGLVAGPAHGWSRRRLGVRDEHDHDHDDVLNQRRGPPSRHVARYRDGNRSWPRPNGNSTVTATIGMRSVATTCHRPAVGTGAATCVAIRSPTRERPTPRLAGNANLSVLVSAYTTVDCDPVDSASSTQYVHVLQVLTRLDR